jgi:LAO/AO transport system kinase
VHNFDRRALGLQLTRLANARVEDVLAMAPGGAIESCRIGLTGPPGAGKSSLGGRLALFRAHAHRVGVLAIDPSSPVSGGAILGDRIRIDELDQAANLYVRSIASRSAYDGLANNLPELLHAMERAGFNELILETVGVGQSAYGARSQVETLVLVLVPGTGDVIQAMKAGIMELADIYVVHKADLPGAQELASEIKSILQFASPGANGWTPPILSTSVRDSSSIERLSLEIDRHQAWLSEAGLATGRRLERARYRLRSLLERRLAETVAAWPEEFFDQPLSVQFARALDGLALAGARPASAGCR